MAKKNLIIGGYTNYGINQLKPWVLSALEVADDNTDVVLIAGSTSKETVQWLTQQGVVVIPMIQVQNVPIHVLRFLSIYDFLCGHWQTYNYVVTTDVKDVYFQTNPFTYLDSYLMKSKKIIAASEGLRYKDEPWGNENLHQAYGQYVYDKFKDNEIYNVGVIGGYSEYVKDLVFNIFTNATNRPIPICDQAVYNVLINTQPFKDVIQFHAHDYGWAVQAGTTVDPSKIDQFRPCLLCKEPTFEDGYVLNLPDSPASKFAIVHQYDRVPEWKKFIQKKYGQEDESQYFIYRT